MFCCACQGMGVIGKMMKLAVSALYYAATEHGKNPKIVYQALLKKGVEIDGYILV
jgi:hypothetical protein